MRCCLKEIYNLKQTKQWVSNTKMMINTVCTLKIFLISTLTLNQNQQQFMRMVLQKKTFIWVESKLFGSFFEPEESPNAFFKRPQVWNQPMKRCRLGVLPGSVGAGTQAPVR